MGSYDTLLAGDADSLRELFTVEPSINAPPQDHLRGEAPVIQTARIYDDVAPPSEH